MNKLGWHVGNSGYRSSMTLQGFGNHGVCTTRRSLSLVDEARSQCYGGISAKLSRHKA